ncbi:pyridoxal-dependent decarboxylase [Endozoicomonas sp.]|uniref:pyridoxal-dependent decarboxylase n=1 Tax=Endozoicomonas sp. TaxID=1892382 RepID=UPI00383BC92C
MITRRRFLSASGMAVSAGLCRPVIGSLPDHEEYVGVPDKFQRAFLNKRRQLLAQRDPRTFLGYPCSMKPAPEGMIRWCRELEKVEFGIRHMNNVGNPHHPEDPWNCFSLEQDVVSHFAKRYGFPDNNIWGIVSHSGTDSNIQGAYIGRTLLKQRTGQQPKIFYSREAHYSMQIICDLFGLEGVPVQTNGDASMNMDDLEKQLAQHPDSPVLLIATIGATFRGGIDDIDAIQEKLQKRESYLHVDAALFGGYLQASPRRAMLQQTRNGKRRYNSLAISWHKFFGYHGVAGLFVCGRDDFEQYHDAFAKVHDPSYTPYKPGTISCSRDSIKPAQVHYYTTSDSFAQQQADAKLVLASAAYLQSQLQNNFPQLNSQRASDLSNIVYFDNLASPELVRKWTLSTLPDKGNDGTGWAHVVTMPHASRNLLDRFLNDLEDDLRA